MARPEAYNVPLHDMNTEYHQRVTGGFRKWLIKCRNAFDLRVSFQQGGTTGNYILIKCGTSWSEDDIPRMSQRGEIPVDFYFRCPDANHQVAEITIWR